MINTSIIFKEKNIESTAKTTIEPAGLLHLKKRTYLIYINNNRLRTGFLLKDLPLNEQVGVLGHELAHVADFNQRGLGRMIGWGIAYLNKSQRKKIERKTDQATIAHGLREELLDWSRFVLTSPLTHEAYKKIRMIYYLSPREIEHIP